MSLSPLIQKAKDFATEVHKNHTEKDVLKTPYIFHLQRVARLVQLAGGTDTEIVAAWLHDSVEDTSTTFQDIESKFGSEVAKIVNGLTNLPEWENLPVIEKKTAQAEHMSKESRSVRLVKLADQISGVELDCKNTLVDIEKRRKVLEGVIKVGNSCKGANEGLDCMFDEIVMELKWFLDNSK